MDREGVVQVLRDVGVRACGLPPEDVREDVVFADVGLDSLTVVEYALRLEDALDVELPEEEVTAARTFGALADVVVAKLSVRDVLSRAPAPPSPPPAGPSGAGPR